MAEVQLAAVIQRVLASEQRAREAEQRARDAEEKALIMERAMLNTKSRFDNMKDTHLGLVSDIARRIETIAKVAAIIKGVESGAVVPVLVEAADIITRNTDDIESRCIELGAELRHEANAPAISEFEH